MAQPYKTIAAAASDEFVEKKSRFIGFIARVTTEEAAEDFINSIREKHREATHNVYAYVLANGRARYSDDGEPAKTAGTPVLEAISHAGVSDVIVVVTRYFGGILLGTGGLVRAYTAAASGALNAAEIVTMREVIDCAVTVPSPQFEPARQCIERAGARLADPEFADAVTLRWTMPAAAESPLLAALDELTPGAAPVEVGPAHHAPV